MKELTLKELQNFELDILKNVHNFCVNNGIKYSLYGGTQIGAVRHKGFIPWDDDIDIIMPRPDYEKFLSTYKSDEYKVISKNSDSGCMLAFARVCDFRETTIVSRIPWHSRDFGIWIDVFPADGMPADDVKRLDLYKKVIRLRKNLIYCRIASANFVTYPTFKSKCHHLVRKIIFLNGIFAGFYARQLDRVARTYTIDESKYWASLTNVRSLKEIKHHEKSTFESCILTDFEDFQVYIMNGTDEVLRDRYHDYMKLPPISEQQPKQSYIHFYWKK